MTYVERFTRRLLTRADEDEEDDGPFPYRDERGPVDGRCRQCGGDLGADGATCARVLAAEVER